MESSEAWALPRQATQLHRIEVHAQRYRNRHGEPPTFATLNQSSADLGIVEESRFQGFGISRPGGTATGVAWLTSELFTKRLGLVRELVPATA